MWISHFTAKSTSCSLSAIAGELDELPLPYTFDVCAYRPLRHGRLREHIDRVGRCLFLRETTCP